MKKFIAVFAASITILITSSASALQDDYVVVLKTPQIPADSSITCLSDRVYLAPSYEAAQSAFDAENIESIFIDEEIELPETEFEIEEETAFLSETTVQYPDGANDPYYEKQWYLPYIKAESAWKKGLTGEGIKVGIIDTGINAVHYDLMNRVSNKYNCIAASENVTDSYGHGTMISGVIAAATNNSVCISGITSDVDLAVIKAAEDNATTIKVSHILSGITKAIDLDCDVVNLSLGWKDSSAYTDTVRNEIKRGTEKGIIFIASSGNVAEDTTEMPVFYPAGFDNVISVASVGRKIEDGESVEGLATVDYNGTTISVDEPSSFSVYNDKVTCAAPGYRIRSTFISTLLSSGKYSDPLVAMATSDGTSFSAAMVASAAVIAKQLDPTINYSRFENYLKQSVRDVCTEGYDEYTGYGVLDIEKLIEVIEEDISGPTPEPTPTPAPWDEFDVTIVQKDLDYAIMTMFEEAPSDSRIIAAAYKDGRLISAKVQPVGTGAMGISFKLTCEEETDTVAVFIWAGDGIYPLHECVKQQFITEDEAEDTSAENIRSTNEPEGTQ